MTVVVGNIPIGARLVDCLEPLSSSACLAVRAAGVEGVIRYHETLSPREVQAVFEAKLGLAIVGESRLPGWVPTPGMGALDARRAASKIHDLALPLGGLVLWCDLEQTAATTRQASAYLDEFGAAAILATAIGGDYVGEGQPLTGPELYAVPTITRYWRSLSAQIPEPSCGWVMHQVYPTTKVAGIEADYDFAGHDYRGRAASWLMSTP